MKTLFCGKTHWRLLHPIWDLFRHPCILSPTSCGVRGGDPYSSVAVLSRRMGVAVSSIPGAGKIVDHRGSIDYGARQFQLFSGISNDHSNRMRRVEVVQDGNKWKFNASGATQWFEDESMYRRRRIVERFTSKMLVDYCTALDLWPFDEDFYPGPSMLITSAQNTPDDAKVMSLLEAQQWIGVQK